MVEAVGQEGFWCHNPRSEGWLLPEEEESPGVEGGDAVVADSDESSGESEEWQEPLSPRAQLQVDDDGGADAARGWSRWDGRQYASDETMRLLPKGTLLCV